MVLLIMHRYVGHACAAVRHNFQNNVQKPSNKFESGTLCRLITHTCEATPAAFINICDTAHVQAEYGDGLCESYIS